MNSAIAKAKRSHSNDDSKRSPTKRQFRNENEKKRRDLFSQLVINLKDALDIDNKTSSNDQTNKLDKASILRETALCLRKHHHDLTIQTSAVTSSSGSTVDRSNDILDFSWKPPSNVLTVEEWVQTAIESMHCFFLVAKSDPHNGQIVYISRNISSLLDYSQDELLNRSLFELILPRDHDRLRDYLLKDHRVLEKCDLSWRRATGDEYEQCTITGAFRQVHKEKDEKYLMAIVKVNTLDRALIINDQYSVSEFTTRLNLQGRFIHIDSKFREFLGYSTYELIGHTYFDFTHPDDLPIMVRAHQLWKQNGSGKSDPYRFLSKGQQWVFLQTKCQVQMNTWTGQPQSYLCKTNSIEYSTDFLQKHLSCVPVSSQVATSSSIESSPITIPMLSLSPQRRNSSSDTQITTFLSHLGDETYRTNIREKLNERRIRKRAEIRVREEEIKVIDDILQYVNEFELKLSSNLSLQTINSSSLSIPSTTVNDSISQQSQKVDHQTNKNIEKESQHRVSELERNCDSTLVRSPLTGTIEEFSPRPLPMMPLNISSTDDCHNPSKDETINDSLTSSLFSPQQETFSLPSPMTPFSIPSRPSPLPISPTSSALSPSTNNSRDEINHIIPSTSTSTNILPEDKSNKKSSFNRSLPHSLFS